MPRFDRLLLDRRRLGRRRGRAPSDAEMVAIAAAAWLGAAWRPVEDLNPLLPVAVLVVVAALRRPLAVAMGIFVLASVLAGRSHAGLVPPEPTSVEAVVTLLSDPTETAFGQRADAKLGHRRVELRASRSAAGILSGALAGERLEVTGKLAAPPQDAPWLVARHISARLSADQIEPHDAGAAHHRGANRFRRLLERGAESLPPKARGLFAGFVLGDDRGQSPEVVDDFRGSGLTHVLVVSGSNVAFVLMLCTPLTNRFGPAGRWIATILVIAAFALVTRFEPSVLRASAMAAVAVTGTAIGRPTRSLRTLANATAGLLLIDPLLVHALAFQLSVGASLGIVALGPWIRSRMPGPRAIADATAVTFAAQVGVMPILIPRFGGLPVVSLPANLLAVPVAGLATTWGMPAGVIAGILGEPWAPVLHMPTRLMVGWVAEVARVASSVPLGEIDASTAVVAILGAGCALHLRASATASKTASRAMAVLAATSLLAPAVALRSAPVAFTVARGVVLYRHGGGTVLEVGANPYLDGVLEGLRRQGVRRIDLIIWSDDPEPSVLRAIEHRWPVRAAIAGSGPRVSTRVGGLEVIAGGGMPAEVSITGSARTIDSVGDQAAPPARSTRQVARPPPLVPG